jgi:hypothetical protein
MVDFDSNERLDAFRTTIRGGANHDGQSWCA